MPVSREDVFSFLYTLTANVTWDTPARTFITRSRRLKLFNEVSVEQQPALFQVEHDEQVDQVTGMPYKQVWNASWMIYQATGMNPEAEPAIENNLILDALMTALAPVPRDPGFQSKRNTLMGRVHHCYVSGEVFKDPGDIDNQGMMVLPIKILVP
jgi:hypothetical protein